MDENNHKNILEKATQLNIGEVLVNQFMNIQFISLGPNYSIKSTIETFRLHHISGAPVINHQGKILGVISEYDLLIQSASRPINDPIEFKTQVTAIQSETTLKDVLVVFYKYKLKWLPVLDKHEKVIGVVTRIDVLHFLAKHTN